MIKEPWAAAAAAAVIVRCLTSCSHNHRPINNNSQLAIRLETDLIFLNDPLLTHVSSDVIPNNHYVLFYNMITLHSLWQKKTQQICKTRNIVYNQVMQISTVNVGHKMRKILYSGSTSKAHFFFVTAHLAYY